MRSFFAIIFLYPTFHVRNILSFKVKDVAIHKTKRFFQIPAEVEKDQKQVHVYFLQPSEQCPIKFLDRNQQSAGCCMRYTAKSLRLTLNGRSLGNKSSLRRDTPDCFFVSLLTQHSRVSCASVSRTVTIVSGDYHPVICRNDTGNLEKLLADV